MEGIVVSFSNNDYFLGWHDNRFYFDGSFRQHRSELKWTIEIGMAILIFCDGSNSDNKSFSTDLLWITIRKIFLVQHESRMVFCGSGCALWARLKLSMGHHFNSQYFSC